MENYFNCDYYGCSRFEECSVSDYWDESYYYACIDQDQDTDWDEEYPDEEYYDSDLEMGFDPYEGCYTYDC